MTPHSDRHVLGSSAGGLCRKIGAVCLENEP